MRIGRWMRDHPRVLEEAYRLAHGMVRLAAPLVRRAGPARVDRWLLPVEEAGKRLIFDCRMCGQCILHSTGMTCPMTCPKELRNGPCGGVRATGHCEVIPEMRCVWVEAWERSRRMRHFGDEIRDVQPPVNRRLEGHSAWINQLTGVDRIPPPGWVSVTALDVLDG